MEADRLRHPAQAGPGHSVPTTHGDPALVWLQQTQQHLENINRRNYNYDYDCIVLISLFVLLESSDLVNIEETWSGNFNLCVLFFKTRQSIDVELSQ